MKLYEYDDFRVTFSPAAGGDFAIEATDVTGATSSGRFRIPVSREDLERAFLSVGGGGKGSSSRVARDTAVGARDRSLGGPGLLTEAATVVGAALADALFADDIGRAYDAALEAAEERQRGLRLTLLLTAAPALLSLPWELLYRGPVHLGSQRRTPVVRQVDVGRPGPAPVVDGAARILGVVVSPADLPPLDVAAERARVQHALATVIETGRLSIDWLEPATPRSLRHALRDGDYHVVHFVGHRGQSAEGEGILFLEGDDGHSSALNSAMLANLLADQRQLRLVVLASVEGVRNTIEDPDALFAVTLLSLGVPSVVTTQFEMSDAATELATEELYTNLIARQAPIDAAIAETRTALFAEIGGLEWAASALYVRDPTETLYRFRAAPEPGLLPPQRPDEPLSRFGEAPESDLPPVPSGDGRSEPSLRGGRTPLVHDQPATTDQLGRRDLAKELAALVQDLAADPERPEAFALHLDGAWGTGKTTFVRFLADELRQPGGRIPPPAWTTIELDAWRSSQLSPAWWALLNHLRRGVRGHMSFWPRRLFDFKLLGREVGRLWRVLVPAALVVAALVALWSANADVNATMAAVTTAVAFVAAVGGLGSRVLSLGTLQGARLHERLNDHPMDEVAERICWVRAQSDRPVLLVLDDLDRCNERFAVELLDAVQTLLRSPVRSGRPAPWRLRLRRLLPKRWHEPKPIPALVVLAVGDHRWLRAAYEHAYSVFSPYVSEPGRPLGHLFLDKLFQVRVELPKLNQAQVEGYVASLLKVRPSHAPPTVDDKALEARIRAVPEGVTGADSIDDSLSQLLAQSSSLSPDRRQHLAGIALEVRRNDPLRAVRERHLLQEYVALLEPNPRAAKRFVMSYNLAFAARLTELEPADSSRTLALWTVVSTRWPALADWVMDELPDGSLRPVETPDHPSHLLRDPEVQRVVTSVSGGPLNRARLLQCMGFPGTMEDGATFTRSEGAGATERPTARQAEQSLPSDGTTPHDG